MFFPPLLIAHILLEFIYSFFFGENASFPILLNYLHYLCGRIYQLNLLHIRISFLLIFHQSDGHLIPITICFESHFCCYLIVFGFDFLTNMFNMAVVIQMEIDAFLGPSENN